MNRNRWYIPFNLALAMVFAASAFAQQVGSAAGEPVVVSPSVDPEWGTASQSASVTQVTKMSPPFSTVTWQLDLSSANGVGMFETSAAGDWWGEAVVPSGALVQSVQLEACDTSTTGALLFGLARSTAPAAGVGNVTPVGSTGVAATPGCAFFSTPVTPPFTVTNGSQGLHLFLSFGTTDNTNRAYALRVFYTLQVSPAPATATFADVSNAHPFYQYIEALAASGITAGCTPPPNPNYCPDSALTRGQMAVFLARALGLHWAP